MNSGHALVVGASSGIGLAISMRLKREGYTVSGISRRMPPADAVDAAQCCDVTDADGLIAAIRRLSEKHGTPAILIYSAGYPLMGDTLHIPEAEAHKVFDVQFWGLDRVVKAVIPEMHSAGGGTILAILSIAAICPPAFESYYSASKAAAAAYLRALALEPAHDSVKLKWLAPGYIDTGFLERGKWFGMSVPKVRGSGVTPENVAEAAVRIIRSDSDWRVIGWKERCLVLGERFSPRLIRRWYEAKR
jgi:short-subunit dehydrogenase